MRIVRTARAEEDLIEIWSYIAKENETAADRTLDALERKTRLLGLHPHIGREQPDIGKGVRSAISGAYLILYQLLGDRVEVVRYVHIRRRLEGLN
ncbi:type II toxin-antitoxin system RelE/ParE family toxin [Methylocystis sp. L43]|jgi:toxin ParE1/3/4|uniref:type II toxin-antitoxin system RelE/ParE family toxin n=1 Tax=unclassified Methylocystis TaxID=2625913 RepID=UPI0018C26455|nr:MULTISPECIES: type II toxin-antitoxin system RelE/ParE family toxin [unclassified Methylocystis]MBG0798224.1 type II toxin-antitoxin system RelE/ParE family toxin [Methylocystis sp. L43]MBG0805691.1 type II toxin-antitoxin system RelE/ParE family toxin [Methylocystis sp. H15]